MNALMVKAAVLIALFVNLLGCSLAPRSSSSPVGDRVSMTLANAGFRAVVGQEASMPVRAWLRDGSGDEGGGGKLPVMVVFEADGAAWRLRGYLPPSNPTPHRAVGAEIASALAHAFVKNTVLYVGRHCQFVSPESSSFQAQCLRNHLWTTGRFGEKVVQDMSWLLDTLKTDELGDQNRRLILIGFSGGGTLASLVAMRRSDAACLVTFAAPLDLAAWVAWHGLTPLTESLDPADALHALVRVRHRGFWFGGQDRVVPPAAFGRLGLSDPLRAHLHVAEGFGHAHADLWIDTAADRLRRSCASLFE